MWFLSVMQPSKSTLDPNAVEFKPSGMTEKVQAMEFIFGFINTVFEASGRESEEAFDKVSP